MIKPMCCACKTRPSAKSSHSRTRKVQPPSFPGFPQFWLRLSCMSFVTYRHWKMSSIIASHRGRSSASPGNLRQYSAVHSCLLSTVCFCSAGEEAKQREREQTVSTKTGAPPNHSDFSPARSSLGKHTPSHGEANPCHPAASLHPPFCR